MRSNSNDIEIPLVWKRWGEAAFCVHQNILVNRNWCSQFHKEISVVWNYALNMIILEISSKRELPQTISDELIISTMRKWFPDEKFVNHTEATWTKNYRFLFSGDLF